MSVISKRIFKVSHLMEIKLLFHFFCSLGYGLHNNYHFLCIFLIFVFTESIPMFICILRWIVCFYFWNRNTYNKTFEFRFFDHVDNNLRSGNGIHSNEIYFQNWSCSEIPWCFWLQFNQADDSKGVKFVSSFPFVTYK